MRRGRLGQSSDLPGSGSLLVKPGGRVVLQAGTGHQSSYNPVASDSICFPSSRLVRWAPLNFEETIVQAKLAAPVDKVFGSLTDPTWLEARSLALVELSAGCATRKAAGRVTVTIERRVHRELNAVISKARNPESDGELVEQRFPTEMNSPLRAAEE